MKLQLSLALILFWGTNLIAQNKAILSGKLNPESNLTEISIRDIDGVVVAAPVKEDGSFMLSTDKLLKGFYEISDMGTVYLKPGFSLVTSYDGKQYKFSGNGAVENNALIQARADLNKFFPLDEKNQPLQETYYLDVPVFLEKMQSFYEHGEKLFSQSSDAFFKEFALLDLKFVGREMTWLYSLYYGKDLKKMEAFHDLIQNADREDPGFSKKLDSAYRATNVKQIDSVSLKNLQAFLYESWDKNNEVLFKNSSAYRRGISNFLSYMASQPRYRLEMQGYDRMLVTANTLKVARGEISSPYIREYFEYTVTGDVLKMARDTATLGKYYREYLANSKSEKNRKLLKEVYDNAITFTDNASAPAFSYKDVTGKTVSLQDLRGKYVYIDVWATWCAPCKAEIPHLKKVEADYHGKNIEFVSISVDQQKDWGKWETFVRDNNLTGIQLVADKAFESEFIKKMNINAIPRFILIDPDGKIVSADALRPSNKALRDQLDKLL